MAAQGWIGSASRRLIRGRSCQFVRNNQPTASHLTGLNVGGAQKWFRLLNTSAAQGMGDNNSETAVSLCRTGAPPSQVLMPALSPTMEEGAIVKWLKKEGDPVSPGDDLCEIETDKATVILDTEEEGILAKIIVPEGTRNIKISKLIALIAEEGEDISKVTVPRGLQVSYGEPATTLDARQPSQVSNSSLAGLSPAVRLLLETYELDPRLIPATGPKGRLLKGDVLRFVAQGGRPFAKPGESLTDPSLSVPPPPAAAPAVTAQPQSAPGGAQPSVNAEHTDIPHTNMRRTIAKRLAESKATIPHTYAVTDCKMDTLLELRAQLKERGTKISVNDMIVKAAALALRLVPEMNAVWKNGEAHLLSDVDISVAVATDSGLITPIIKDAANLQVTQISSILKDLATRAREGKLQLHEFQGGSFTISNLGMFGITEFSAVINPPQACIMAVGGTKAVLGSDEIVHKVMRVTLSCDGRMVDEKLMTKWLEEFRNNIENPGRLAL